MKLTTLIIIGLLMIPVIVFLTMIGYQSYSIDHYRTVEMALEVADYHGFNVNSSKLNLGAIPPGGYVFRNFTVFNTEEVDRDIELKVVGPMAPWTTLSHEKFTLAPGENLSVKADVQPPGDTKMAYYNSTIYVLYKRAR
jgi:hypothetical protein